MPDLPGRGPVIVQKTRIKNGKVLMDSEHEPCPACRGTRTSQLTARIVFRHDRTGEAAAGRIRRVTEKHPSIARYVLVVDGLA